MELKRRVGVWMSFLLILETTATAIALSDYNNQSLRCTNDFHELMSCDFEAQNCTGYRLTLNSEYGEVQCIFSERCDIGRCCCSTEMVIVLGESHTAIVSKGGKSLESKTISILETIKPRVPEIISVEESNGNFEVKWTSKMKNNREMTATVTYHKKGDAEMINKSFTPLFVDDLNYYEISGRNLEPSTTYMVSVRTRSEFSHLFSDSSEEVDFTTAASHENVILAIIISLSIAAVIITGAMYGSYVKVKAKWWDAVPKYPNPKLLNMRSSEQKVLTSVQPIMSKVCVEPLISEDSKPWSKGSLTDISSGSLQQSSGISTGSSCLSYAITEPNIMPGVPAALWMPLAKSPISSLTTNLLKESNKDRGLFFAPFNFCDVKAADTSSGSSSFDNKTYSILLPSSPHQITADSSESQKQAEMLCESAYQPSEGNILIWADQQVPACQLLPLPSGDSALMPTDMSYQQCNADSGRFSYAEDSSLSSISSGTNTAALSDPVFRAESSDEVVCDTEKPNGEIVEAIKSDENPCYGCVPAGSCSFPPVADDYQSFQSLVQQPDILFSEQRQGEEEEHLEKYKEKSITTIPHSLLSPFVPGFTENVQAGLCSSELPNTFLSLIPADQSMPVIIDSGYQCV